MVGLRRRQRTAGCQLVTHETLMGGLDGEVRGGEGLGWHGGSSIVGFLRLQLRM